MSFTDKPAPLVHFLGQRLGMTVPLKLPSEHVRRVLDPLPAYSPLIIPRPPVERIPHVGDYYCVRPDYWNRVAISKPL